MCIFVIVRPPTLPSGPTWLQQYAALRPAARDLRGVSVPTHSAHTGSRDATSSCARLGNPSRPREHFPPRETARAREKDEASLLQPGHAAGLAATFPRGT